jgi:hypothetical protein
MLDNILRPPYSRELHIMICMRALNLAFGLTVVEGCHIPGNDI